MKQTLFFCILALLLPFATSAQKLEKKFSDKLCECSQKINADLEPGALQKEVEHCIDVAVAMNREEMKKVFVDLSDEEVDKRVNNMIMKTVKDCPAFNKLYLKVERETTDNEDRSGKKHSVPSECKQMHEGTFRYVGEGDSKTVYISRKGDKQYEGHDNDSYYVHSRIEWVDECTYISTFWETNDPKLKALYKKGQSITVTITGVNGLNFSYYTNLGGAKINADMVKVSDDFIDPSK